MSSCPVEECSEVKELKACLRRWASAILILVTLVGGAGIYTWSNALRIPELIIVARDHEKRLTITETQVSQIYDNTEEIKKWIHSQILLKNGVSTNGVY